MNLDWTGIGVIIGIVGTAILGLYNGFRKFFASNRIVWENTFKGSSEIDSLLYKFAQEQVHLDMASLIVAENGGGVPHPASKIKTSIVSEGFTDKLSSYKDNWQNVPVDSYYMTFLRECSLAGSCTVDDTELLEESMIKDAALSIGVTSFKLVYVKAFKRAWYYIVLSSLEGKFPVDPKTNDEVRVLISEINRLMNK